MALIVLSSSQAFNPGADLWITPDFEHSKMASKLDWYINFKAGEITRKPHKALSDFLATTVTKIEFPVTDFSTNEHAPILIPTHNSFPNRWTAFLPYENNPADWCQKISKLYLELKSNTFRIFLPTNLGMNEFTEAWRSISSFEDFSIVLEN